MINIVQILPEFDSRKRVISVDDYIKKMKFETKRQMQHRVFGNSQIAQKQQEMVALKNLQLRSQEKA